MNTKKTRYSGLPGHRKTRHANGMLLFYARLSVDLPVNTAEPLFAHLSTSFIYFRHHYIRSCGKKQAQSFHEPDPEKTFVYA
ncbi:MAG: hypothetical protein IKH30_01075 [Clostridia bacterium]|nr:hypothetical protein [Clostridia bacterium]